MKSYIKLLNESLQDICASIEGHIEDSEKLDILIARRIELEEKISAFN